MTEKQSVTGDSMLNEIMTFAEAAAYLKIGEKTLQRMISRKEIPCTKVGNQWRFMKSIVDDWLISGMEHHTTNSVEKVILNHEMIRLSRITRYINTGLQAGSPESILQQLSSPLADSGLIDPVELYVRKLIQREEMVSTAIGKGCAIPHIRMPGENPGCAPLISAGLCREGTDFNSLDGEPTRLFFLIHADNEATHLRILARVTEMIRDSRTVSRLLQARGEEDFIEAVISYESRADVAQ